MDSGQTSHTPFTKYGSGEDRPCPSWGFGAEFLHLRPFWSKILCFGLAKVNFEVIRVEFGEFGVFGMSRVDFRGSWLEFGAKLNDFG